MPGQDNLVGQAIVQAARACIGAPFRLHGRTLAGGLDCVGLVVCALVGAGCGQAAHAAPTGYRLRGGQQGRYESYLRAAGLVPVLRQQSGDILMAEASPAQFHLMVMTGAGFVHAHAGLRRVVETPGLPPWPVLGVWRFISA